MRDNLDAAPRHDDERKRHSLDYLRQAVQANNEGDALLAMHLYLASFEEMAALPGMPDEEALSGLKRAWQLACDHKERAMAEYIFEKMEPYLSSQEIASCAEKLQMLALDKLEEFGLSREDLQDMTEMISQDFLGLDAHIVKVENLGEFGRQDGSMERLASDGAAEDESADGALAVIAQALPTAAPEQEEEPLNYDTLVGFEGTVAVMRDFGIGMQDNPHFQKLVKDLNAHHGLSSMPIVDSLLFRSPAREDAERFLEATLEELNLPTLRMNMEENPQGVPILCVTADPRGVVSPHKFNPFRNGFEGGGVVVLQDVDLWQSPMIDLPDDPSGFFIAQISRGAREAIQFIRSAVENPDVYVLATASSEGEIDTFFLDMLEPLSLIDIDYPNASERRSIWNDILTHHPSMAGIDREELVRLSSGLPRFDIYMAAREAIEEAYKAGLVTRQYVAVTRENLFDKLAAYQPLDSEEYHELEEAVLKEFRDTLGDLDDLFEDE